LELVLRSQLRKTTIYGIMLILEAKKRSQQRFLSPPGIDGIYSAIGGRIGNDVYSMQGWKA